MSHSSRKTDTRLQAEYLNRELGSPAETALDEALARGEELSPVQARLVTWRQIVEKAMKWLDRMLTTVDDAMICSKCKIAPVLCEKCGGPTLPIRPADLNTATRRARSSGS